MIDILLYICPLARQNESSKYVELTGYMWMHGKECREWLVHGEKKRKETESRFQSKQHTLAYMDGNPFRL